MECQLFLHLDSQRNDSSDMQFEFRDGLLHLITLSTDIRFSRATPIAANAVLLSERSLKSEAKDTSRARVGSPSQCGVAVRVLAMLLTSRIS